MYDNLKFRLGDRCKARAWPMPMICPGSQAAL